MESNIMSEQTCQVVIGAGRIVTIIYKKMTDYVYYGCVEKPKIYLHLKGEYVISPSNVNIFEFLTSNKFYDLERKIYSAMIMDYKNRSLDNTFGYETIDVDKI
jgi:hypothetical protein